VTHAIGRNLELDDLPLEALQSFSNLIEQDVFAALSLEDTLATKAQLGGTAPARVREALLLAKKQLAAD